MHDGSRPREHLLLTTLDTVVGGVAVRDVEQPIRAECKTVRIVTSIGKVPENDGLLLRDPVAVAISNLPHASVGAEAEGALAGGLCVGNEKGAVLARDHAEGAAEAVGEDRGTGADTRHIVDNHNRARRVVGDIKTLSVLSGTRIATEREARRSPPGRCVRSDHETGL